MRSVRRWLPPANWEPAQRVYSRALIHRINELLGRNESALQHAGLQRMPKVERSFATVRERVQELLDMVCSDLLEPHRLKIAPSAVLRHRQPGHRRPFCAGQPAAAAHAQR